MRYFKTFALVLFVGINTFGFLATPANATVIGFDALNTSAGPVIVTNQFAGQGVTFSGLAVVAQVPLFTVSGPNAGVLNDEFPFNTTATAIFSADVTNVSATFFDTEELSLLVEMIAFDIDGNTLDSITVFTPDSLSGGAFVSVGAPGIRRITMRTDIDGATFDDFAFLPSITLVPVPAALPLFLSALAGLGLIGWRRRKAT